MKVTRPASCLPVRSTIMSRVPCKNGTHQFLPCLGSSCCVAHTHILSNIQPSRILRIPNVVESAHPSLIGHLEMSSSRLVFTVLASGVFFLAGCVLEHPYLYAGVPASPEDAS